MSTPVFGQSEAVLAWMHDRLPNPPARGLPAIGFADNAGNLIAGFAYSRFKLPNIELAAAVDNARWATRGALAVIFRYPFVQLGCGRVTAIVPHWNARSRHCVERMGFTHEGTLRRALPDGSDAIVYGLLKEECRWL